MRISDVYTAKAVAIAHTEAASNKIPYLGTGFFPAKKKMGLDLKWIKTSKGLPVSLAPAAFDTNSTIRSREGFSFNETEMPFFKESMIVKEADEQEIMRVQDSADPYAQDVINAIYHDAETLVEGADVVPERMRMQLLSSATTTAGPTIAIQANGMNYAYNYDPDGTYLANNVINCATKWDATAADPMADVQNAQDAIEGLTGTRPTILLISKATMKLLRDNAKIKAYILTQNPNASVFLTDNLVKDLFKTQLDVSIVVYSKQFKDESGTTHKFYPDDHATLLPAGSLGSTWYGCTPDERTGMADPTKDVSIVNTGVAVAVRMTDDPNHTKTTVSEICLPSFERMDETCQLLILA